MAHTVDKFVIEITNSNGEDARVFLRAEPPLPEGEEEFEETPNLLMAEAIMEYLEEMFDSETEAEVLH